MTLETIYYVTQIIAVVAILISLCAIWFQMRQSTQIERAAAQREVLERVSQWNCRFEPDDYHKFLYGLSDLDGSPGDIQSLTEGHLYDWMFVMESALNMHNSGYFSDGTLAGVEGVTTALLRTPGGAGWWTYAQHVLGFEVVNFTNKRLSETSPNAPTFLEFSPYYKDRVTEMNAILRAEPPVETQTEASEDTL